MGNTKIKRLTLGGMLAAVVFVMTFFIKLPVPITNGYIHLGDGAIFFSALLLADGTGILAAALGSALADIAGGYLVYALPTFLIKGAMAWIASAGCRRNTSWLRCTLFFILAELIMVAGYCLFETFMYGFPAAAGAIFPNLIQGIGGVVFGMLFRLALPRLRRLAD